MQRRSFEAVPCAIARSSDVFGDAWALVILREALFGCDRFDDFRARLDIPRATLADRLRKLVEAQVMRIEPDEDDRRSHRYLLEPRGRDLWVVLLAIQQWGNRWLFDPQDRPSFIVDRSSGQPLEPLAPMAADGQAIDLGGVTMQAGPGATEALRSHFASLP